MIAFITICYILLYILLFNKLKLIAKTNGNISAFICIGVAMIGGIVFSGYTFAAVTQDARLYRYVIPIVPNVRGLIE